MDEQLTQEWSGMWEGPTFATLDEAAKAFPSHEHLLTRFVTTWRKVDHPRDRKAHPQ
jgi:hypothetical protein